MPADEKWWQLLQNVWVKPIGTQFSIGQESKLIDFWDTADFYRHPTIVIPDIYNLNQVQEEEEEEEEEKEGEGWSSGLF